MASIVKHVVFVDEHAIDFNALKPDVVFTGPLVAEKINEQAIRLLREALYPSVIVEGVKRLTAETLGAYGRFSISSEPFLKASRTLLLPLNAVITITGADHLAGHFLVSAKEETIRDARAGLFGEQPVSIEALEDMVGEICNMLAGGIKAIIEKKEGTQVTIGVPTFIRGNKVSFRRGMMTPSLTIGAAWLAKPSSARPGEDLFAELYFERIDPAIFAAKDERELLTSDEITFL